MLSSTKSSTPQNSVYRSPHTFLMSVIRRTSSLDSLIATNFGSSAMSANIGGVISTPYDTGLL